MTPTVRIASPVVESSPRPATVSVFAIDAPPPSSKILTRVFPQLRSDWEGSIPAGTLLFVAGKNQTPRRSRSREKATLSDGLTKVALVTSPTSNDPGSLASDVALAKSAVLYADEVEMVGLAVSLLERLRQITSQEYGFLRWYLDLDDAALEHALGPGFLARMPRGWRNDFKKAIDYDRYRTTDPLR